MNKFPLFLLIYIFFIGFSVNLNTRELSIKDLEERKKIDRERELQREKRGKKNLVKK